MQFVINKVRTITRSIAVEADSPEAAKEKEGEGKTVSLDDVERTSVSLRPEPRVIGGPVGGLSSPLQRPERVK